MQNVRSLASISLVWFLHFSLVYISSVLVAFWVRIVVVTFCLFFAPISMPSLLTVGKTYPGKMLLPTCPGYWHNYGRANEGTNYNDRRERKKKKKKTSRKKWKKSSNWEIRSRGKETAVNVVVTLLLASYHTRYPSSACAHERHFLILK